MENLLKLIDELKCSMEAKDIYKNILLLSANFTKEVAVLVPIEISLEFHDCSRFLDGEIQKHTPMAFSHAAAGEEGRVGGEYLWGYVGLTKSPYGFHETIRQMISRDTPIGSIFYLIVQPLPLALFNSKGLIFFILWGKVEKDNPNDTNNKYFKITATAGKLK